MKKKYYSRKGFTLVELLIVIVVIGILSAMMMLSSTEAMSSAKASNIASNLRNLKTAALAWYTDHIDVVDTSGQIDGTINGTKQKGRIQNLNKNDSVLGIGKYLNNESSFVLNPDGNGYNQSNSGGYFIKDAGSSNTSSWFVGYIFPTNGAENSIKEKLKGKATSLGLIFCSGTDPQNKGDGSVWMRIFGEYNPN